MLFNSLDFAIFFPIFFFLYWVIFKNSIDKQNILIVIASYLFYSFWDLRFLSLIVFSTALDYILAKRIENSQNNKYRRIFLILSLVFNLGILGVFKYYNFFIDNFNSAFSVLGISLNLNSLEFILPVGISFYTFQTLSYTIDVYRCKMKASNSLIQFAAFVSFFPQLVAGPIERATNLLPQFNIKRNFSYEKAVEGSRQILWGLFKKVVIADSCAQFVDVIFDNYEIYNSSTLIIGAILFAFQIYGDFSGYSDIAIGLARILGFNLMKNFSFPYFSRDIAEFWRRWHISLSTWFKDYLYIPLGGSKGGTIIKVRNIFTIFLVSGFWHGANWTFIIWGAINAICYLPLMLANKNRSNLQNKELKIFSTDIFKILLTFSITCIAWIFFRAENIFQAVNYIHRIFTDNSNGAKIHPIGLLIIIAIFILAEWLNKKSDHTLDFKNKKINTLTRWSFYTITTVLIIIFFGKGNSFIYFQF